MNIARMTDVELVREIAGRCITDMAAVDLAQFIRRCVKESMLTKKEIKKIILENGTGVLGLHEDSRLIYPNDLAHALRKAMEGSND